MFPDREESVVKLDRGHDALETLFDHLSEEELTRPATIGSGEWSAKDLMGHIAFWEELATETVTEWRRGQRPSVEGIFNRGQQGVDDANARNQARTATQSVAAVMARSSAAHAAIKQTIRQMPEAEWRSKAFYSNAHKPTLAEVLGSVLGAPRLPFGHAFAHLPGLKSYVKSLSKP
jgi:hypothetical protein